MGRQRVSLYVVRVSTSAVVVVACLLAAGVAGSASAVPDARITVAGAEAAPTDPVVGERTEVNVTVANSAGSPDPARVTTVRMLDADGNVRTETDRVGSLSAGDTLEARLWTRFEEPGEHRLTVEVVAEEVADDTENPDNPPTVTVERDLVVDVEPATSDVALRARALAPEDLQTQEDQESVSVGGVNGIDGLLGANGGGLESNTDTSEAATAMDAPVALTVVNTGTMPADRVHLTATGTVVGGVERGGASGVVGGDGGDGADRPDRAETTTNESTDFEAGPYVIEDVAPGEERQVILDLGTLDRHTAVTFTATFRSSAEPPDGSGPQSTATTTLVYPPRRGQPILTEANVTRAGDGTVRVEGNLGNAGDAEVTGIVVTALDAPGVTPTPPGGGYFVGSVAADEFAPFELTVTANATAASTVPVQVAYTDRGVRYVETVELDPPSRAEPANGSAPGTATVFGGVTVLGSDSRLLDEGRERGHKRERTGAERTSAREVGIVGTLAAFGAVGLKLIARRRRDNV